ncbi:hypothetical protein C0J52_31472 [Blattella germanica]|nr:hypothetical protein C0J52_31472 [Blattella germanica]
MDIPQEEDGEPEPGFFNTITELGRRAKRGFFDNFLGTGSKKDEEVSSTTTANLWGFWNGPATATTATPERERRSTAAEEAEEEEEEDDLESTTDHVVDTSAAHRPHPVIAPVEPEEDDDEDYFNEPASGSGHGHERTPSPPIRTPGPPVDGTQPRFYRTTITILEPFIPEYLDRNSQKFQQISQELSQAVQDLYKNVPGSQSATVIQIQSTGEVFQILVTLDLGTMDNYDENQLRERLHRHISTYRRLGNYAASEENFTFRSFQDLLVNPMRFPAVAVSACPRQCAAMVYQSAEMAQTSLVVVSILF